MGKSTRRTRNAQKLTRRQRQQSEEGQVKQIQQNLEAMLEHEQNKTKFGPLVPKNDTQRKLVQFLDERRLIVATGPSGVGKTFVATSWAAEALEAKRIERIWITRPMVGCDEDMGFFPGTELEKFIGWVGPLMEVLIGKLGKSKVETYIKYEKIGVRPLMLMRGATFRNSVVILDEAQNTTPGQMKMFLTRIGEGSKVVVDGDPEQTDLPGNRGNGLLDVLELFRGSPNIGFVNFSEDEIVRDPLVREIVLAYRHRNKIHDEAA